MDVDPMTEDKSAGASYKASKPVRKRKQFPVSDFLVITTCILRQLK